MTRAIIKFTDGSHINIEADYIHLRDDDKLLTVWRGNDLVALTKLESVSSCHLSESTEKAVGKNG